MSVYAKVGGVWKNVGTDSSRLSGAWKTIVGGWTRVSGTWKRIIGTDLSASATNHNPVGFAFPGNVATTDFTTVNPSGGVAPYTYAWSYVSGDAAIFLFGSSTSATVRWRRGISSISDFFTAVWNCRVTDATGAYYDVTVEPECESAI